MKLQSLLCGVARSLGILAIVGVASVQTAVAHPLGNFTINHLAKIRIHDRDMAVRYVLDIAEIPTFQIMRERSLNGRLDSAQMSEWAKSEVAVVTQGLDIEDGARRVTLRPLKTRVSTRPGAGGLPTLYWSTDFGARVGPAARESGRRISVTDRTYADRIGWKDLIVEPASEPTNELRRYPSALLGSPRGVTELDIRIVGNRAIVRAVSAYGQNAAPASTVRSNALSDMLARGSSNAVFVVLTILAAIGLGALHGLEPGHGKTLLAVSIVGTRATTRQVVGLALSLTAAHTLGVIILGFALLLLAARFVPETIYPWITVGAGAISAMLGAVSVARVVRARRGERHDHDHGSSNRHAHDHTRANDRAQLSFTGVLFAAVSGNVAPCPAALVVLLTALTLHQVAYGLIVVVAFSVGLAGILTGIGLALAHGAAFVSRNPAFDRYTRYGPLVSASVIAIIGAAMIGRGLAASPLHGSAILASFFVLTAIAGYALAPGHSHAKTAEAREAHA